MHRRLLMTQRRVNAIEGMEDDETEHVSDAKARASVYIWTTFASGRSERKRPCSRSTLYIIIADSIKVLEIRFIIG